MFWRLEPEVAGGLGDGSVVDASVHPPVVSFLEYRFHGWQGSDLLETFPCFIVTDRLASELQGRRLSGYELGTVRTATSTRFTELYPGHVLPTFHRLDIVGRAGMDDFGTAVDYSLVVSDEALASLRKFSLAGCDVEPFVPPREQTRP